VKNVRRRANERECHKEEHQDSRHEDGMQPLQCHPDDPHDLGPQSF
jgi:hypothetical protein